MNSYMNARMYSRTNPHMNRRVHFRTGLRLSPLWCLSRRLWQWFW